MARSAPMYILLAATSLTGTLALALQASKEPNAAFISHSGAIRQQITSKPAPQWSTEALKHIAMLRQNGFSTQKQKDSEVEICNDDFELGTENSNDCNAADPGRQAPIDEKALCMRAAKAANVTAPHETFEIPDGFYDNRPSHCFTFPCTEDPKGVCFFYNENPVVPTNPVGTPICFRHKYVNGTVNTAAECPAGYSSILDAEVCRKASHCWTFCDGAQFDANKHNMSEYHNYPQGCFINEKDHCFYFNTVIEHMGTPTSPRGTPVCSVSQALKWPSTVPTFGADDTLGITG